MAPRRPPNLFKGLETRQDRVQNEWPRGEGVIESCKGAEVDEDDLVASEEEKSPVLKGNVNLDIMSHQMDEKINEIEAMLQGRWDMVAAKRVEADILMKEANKLKRDFKSAVRLKTGYAKEAYSSLDRVYDKEDDVKQLTKKMKQQEDEYNQLKKITSETKTMLAAIKDIVLSEAQASSCDVDNLSQYHLNLGQKIRLKEEIQVRNVIISLSEQRVRKLQRAIDVITFDVRQTKERLHGQKQQIDTLENKLKCIEQQRNELLSEENILREKMSSRVHSICVLDEKIAEINKNMKSLQNEKETET